MNSDLFSEMTFVLLCTSGGRMEASHQSSFLIWRHHVIAINPHKVLNSNPYYLSLLAVSHQAT